MTNKLILGGAFAVAALLVPKVASAGGSKGSIGVGAEYQLSGLGGLSANYDAGKFHVGGFLGYLDGGGTDDTTIDLGARFFFHVADSAMSDFGVGANLGLGFVGDGDPNTDNATEFFIEPGFQIRAFVSANVALSFFGGISIGVADAKGVELAGQPTGAAGVHYYFF